MIEKTYTIEVKNDIIICKGRGITIQEAFGIMTKILIESSVERVLNKHGAEITKTKAKKAKK